MHPGNSQAVRIHRTEAAAGSRLRLRGAIAVELPCRTAPELFFAEEPADLRRAKELCRHCPVQPGCLTGALERAEPWGVWGGEMFLRGVVIPDKRPRGRPRKADVAA